MKPYERHTKDPSGFRLLDLPIETRLRIYHHYFAIRYRPTDKRWVMVDSQTGRRLIKQDIWPVFLVCKQMYSEIMPEYYAATKFHFNALVALQDTMKSHKHFNAYVRQIVFNPSHFLPTAQELLQLQSLQTFAVTNYNCYEPVGTPKGATFDYLTLRKALFRGSDTHSEQPQLQRVFDLQDSIAKLSDEGKTGLHILLRFGYSYIEKDKHPDTWGGKTAKRYRLLEYDLTDDMFLIADPDADESPVVRNSIKTAT